MAQPATRSVLASLDPSRLTEPTPGRTLECIPTVPPLFGWSAARAAHGEVAGVLRHMRGGREGGGCKQAVQGEPKKCVVRGRTPPGSMASDLAAQTVRWRSRSA